MRDPSDKPPIDETLNAGEIEAIAPGQSPPLETAAAADELTRLERMARSHFSEQRALLSMIRGLSELLEHDTASAASLQAAIARRPDIHGDRFTMIVGLREHTARDSAGRHLQRITDSAAAKFPGLQPQNLGAVAHLAGFDIHATLSPRGDDIEVSLALPAVPDAVTRTTVAEFVAADPAALVGHLEHHLTDLERQLLQKHRDIEAAHVAIDAAEAQLGQPFAEQAQLDAARQRFAVNAQLHTRAQQQGTFDRVSAAAGERTPDPQAAEAQRVARTGLTASPTTPIPPGSAIDHSHTPPVGAPAATELELGS